MAKCIFEGLTTEQAKVLASWFEGQGEQDAAATFSMRDVEPVFTDCEREGGYREILENGDVIVYCR